MWPDPEVFGIAAIPSGIGGSTDVGRVRPRGPFVPSRPGEFHPEPLTEPDLNLSAYPARATPEDCRLPPTSSSSGCPLTRTSLGDLLPLLLGNYPESALLRSSPPLACASGTFGLAGLPLVPFPFSSQTKFSSSARKPRLESRPLYTGHRTASR